MAWFRRNSGEGEVVARPAAIEPRDPWYTRLRTFFGEVMAELKKTTWPSRKEVTGTTIVVIVAVLITAVFLFVVDKALESGMQAIFRAFGK